MNMTKDYDLNIVSGSGCCISTDYIRNSYLTDISTMYNTPNYTISGGSGIDTTTINSALKDYLKIYMDDYMNQQMKNILNPPPIPMHTSSNTTAPAQTALLTKYPITNNAYTLVTNYSHFPDEIIELHDNHAPINRFIGTIPFSNQFVFIARLENTRFKKEDISEKMNKLGIHEGNTCDPWFRNISSCREKFIIRSLEPEDREWVGYREFQTKVLSNSEEILSFWTLRTSIEKKPIYLILYTIMKLGYIPKIKRQSHIDLISPYNCNIAPNYDFI